MRDRQPGPPKTLSAVHLRNTRVGYIPSNHRHPHIHPCEEVISLRSPHHRRARHHRLSTAASAALAFTALFAATLGQPAAPTLPGALVTPGGAGDPGAQPD